MVLRRPHRIEPDLLGPAGQLQLVAIDLSIGLPRNQVLKTQPQADMHARPPAFEGTDRERLAGRRDKF